MALRQVVVDYDWDTGEPIYDWVDDGTDVDYSNEGNNYPAPVDYSNEGNNYPAPVDYSNEGNNYPTPGSTQGPGGSPVNASTAPDPGFWSTLFDKVKTSVGYDDKKDFGTNLANFLGSKAGMTTIAGLGGLAMGLMDKRPAYGGGTAKAYAGPAKQLTRTVEQGKYGPIAKYAADGGIMHAYASGGPVAMEDGGFVMTKRAVDAAGGPRGIQQLVPGARPIRGPGNGTSDSIPAFIQGAQGRTPARVSNGEAYVPRQAVQQAGGSRRMYDLMNKLQRRA